MSSLKDCQKVIRSLLTGLSLCAFIALSGQPDEEEADLFELSPFIVQAGDDIGYMATTTLAGNGAASATVTANASIGSYQVTATANGVNSSAVFGLTNTGEDVAITKVALSSEVVDGDLLTYTLHFTNNGSSTPSLRISQSSGYQKLCFGI